MIIGEIISSVLQNMIYQTIFQQTFRFPKEEQIYIYNSDKSQTKIPNKILVCGSSNVSVDEIIRNIHQKGLLDEYADVPIIRIGENFDQTLQRFIRMFGRIELIKSKKKFQIKPKQYLQYNCRTIQRYEKQISQFQYEQYRNYKSYRQQVWQITKQLKYNEKCLSYTVDESQGREKDVITFLALDPNLLVKIKNQKKELDFLVTHENECQFILMQINYNKCVRDLQKYHIIKDGEV
ncbi:unnamed protein product [Paramecium octaurelia]|uniref:DNA2/NAM7 helicase helicase domain-containing protein n=1 Tax=Paramecium octaurelia TaxID=43137 RepID=A0A8S1ST85_PAROT|nr:unnamed protein product [Paramecium octaurelia]